MGMSLDETIANATEIAMPSAKAQRTSYKGADFQFLISGRIQLCRIVISTQLKFIKTGSSKAEDTNNRYSKIYVNIKYRTIMLCLFRSGKIDRKWLIELKFGGFHRRDCRVIGASTPQSEAFVINTLER